MGTAATFGYAPVMLVFAVITGLVTGSIFKILLPVLKKQKTLFFSNDPSALHIYVPYSSVKLKGVERMKHDNLSGVLKPVVRGRGGVSVAHHKNTSTLESVRMPAPAKVILPMQQHIGAPCTPTVKPGDKVEIGQVVGDSDKLSALPFTLRFREL